MLTGSVLSFHYRGEYTRCVCYGLVATETHLPLGSCFLLPQNKILHNTFAPGVEECHAQLLERKLLQLSDFIVRKYRQINHQSFLEMGITNTQTHAHPCALTHTLNDNGNKFCVDQQYDNRDISSCAHHFVIAVKCLTT